MLTPEHLENAKNLTYPKARPPVTGAIPYKYIA
jgi:hypothetical protein